MSKIYSLSISNFRGIKNFNETFGFKNFICVIGRGDSGKTTVLDAINLVLSPNWNVVFNDNDFHNHNIDLPIEITATLYDLPELIIKEDKFGLYLRGLDKNSGAINDLIGKNDIPSITIKLIVDRSLEPSWYVINNRDQEDIEIKSSDRAKLNVFYVSDYIERHFNLGKGSPLYTLLKSKNYTINGSELLLETIRHTKKSIDNAAFLELDPLLAGVKRNADKFGMTLSNLKPTIDLKDVFLKEGNLTLHDDPIPIRLKGKGSKRLLSIAIQLELFQNTQGGILLIDEIEQGLETDRCQNLTRILKSNSKNQVFITTHSRDVIVELEAKNLFKLSSGSNKLYTFNESEQGTLRSTPEAFFAKKLILCEGATEVGIVRGINKFNYSNNIYGFSTYGVRYVDCTGDSKIQNFINTFKDKEYDILIFCDSDNDSNSTVRSMKDFLIQNNIKSVQCEPGKAIEHQVFSDLNFEAIKDIFTLDLLEDKESLRNSIKSRYRGKDWRDDFLSLDTTEIRIAIGIAANKKSWFKRIDLGELIGEICMRSLHKITSTHLNRMLLDINKWANND